MIRGIKIVQFPRLQAKVQAAVALPAFLMLILFAGCDYKPGLPPAMRSPGSAQITPPVPSAPATTDGATSPTMDMPEQAGTLTATIEPGKANRELEEDAEPEGAAHEAPVIEIALSGPAALAAAEFSGMAWYGEWLILLPQYPDFFTAGSDGYLFAVHHNTIGAYLEGGMIDAIEPRLLPFSAHGIRNLIEGFEGYEAILFDHDRVFVTIEAASGGKMAGYLLAGRIEPDLGSVIMDPQTLTAVDDRIQMPNKSFETLLLSGDEIVVVHEINGRDLVEQPLAQRFDRDLQLIGTLTLPNVEYRLTDATAVGEDGGFWALNTFFTGDSELFAEQDPIAEKWGEGETHQNNPHVERIVAFEYADGQLRLAGEPPIQLRLLPLISRNWEGIARLDDRGFLIITDKFPSTILAFVPTSTNQ